jgi:hypothetical protein
LHPPLARLDDDHLLRLELAHRFAESFTKTCSGGCPWPQLRVMNFDPALAPLIAEVAHRGEKDGNPRLV